MDVSILTDAAYVFAAFSIILTALDLYRFFHRKKYIRLDKVSFFCLFLSLTCTSIHGYFTEEDKTHAVVLGAISVLYFMLLIVYIKQDADKQE